MLNFYIIFKISNKCEIKSKNSFPFIIKTSYILKFKLYIAYFLLLYNIIFPLLLKTRLKLYSLL
jgi:hypothetical protein